jgi:hypothetical protein
VLCSCRSDLKLQAPYSGPVHVILNSAPTCLAFETHGHQASVFATRPHSRSMRSVEVICIVSV